MKQNKFKKFITKFQKQTWKSKIFDLHLADKAEELLEHVTDNTSPLTHIKSAGVKNQVCSFMF